MRGRVGLFLLGSLAVSGAGWVGVRGSNGLGAELGLRRPYICEVGQCATFLLRRQPWTFLCSIASLPNPTHAPLVFLTAFFSCKTNFKIKALLEDLFELFCV